MNNISTQARLIQMDILGSKIREIFTVIFLTVLLLFLSNFNALAQATVGERINMGLYGGAADDLTYSPTGRLFAGIQTPGSIFSTDDSCKTWKRVFQTDSLEFAGGMRGWGGGGRQIFCNDTGWVLALTQQHGGNL
ncbi:MAG: hypothetical protein JXR34_08875, partial [Bacteroidales bacterium]|nr:hypothetical protein [Bacteroidales bacterium]